MSRIGKLPISLPSGVEINVSKGNLVTVKGPKGELSQQVDPDLGLALLAREERGVGLDRALTVRHELVGSRRCTARRGNPRTDPAPS